MKADVRSTPEQKDHHQRVWEPNFCSVYGTIAGTFEYGEDVMVARVEDDALDGSLFVWVNSTID